MIKDAGYLHEGVGMGHGVAVPPETVPAIIDKYMNRVMNYPYVTTLIQNARAAYFFAHFVTMLPTRLLVAEYDTNVFIRSCMMTASAQYVMENRMRKSDPVEVAQLCDTALRVVSMSRADNKFVADDTTYKAAP